MFHKLVILTCSVAVSTAQYQQQPQYRQAQYQPQYQQAQYQHSDPVQTAAQYPAGVDAQSCPDYPDCSNPLLTVQAVAKASDPRYLVQNAPQAPPRAESQYSPDVQQRLDRGEYIGDGDYHGEGLDEALAPEVAGHPQYDGHAASSQYPAQRAASQYAAQPVASQYAAQPVAVQYPAQNAASQYSAQPGAVQYSAQRAASQYHAAPQYITAPQSHGSQYAQASAFSPQYQPAPVHESRSYSSPVANAIASGSEPVPSVQLPAGIDVNACPNYPFCH